MKIKKLTKRKTKPHLYRLVSKAVLVGRRRRAAYARKLEKFNFRAEHVLILCALLLVLAAILLIKPWQPESDLNYGDDGLSSLISRDIRRDLLATRHKLGELEDEQTKSGVKAVSDETAQASLTAIQVDLNMSNLKKARRDLKKLESEVAVWRGQYALVLAAKQQADAQALAAAKIAGQSTGVASGVRNSNEYLQVPILIYHDTPGDFENQLQNLLAKGYHAIDLDAFVNASHGGALPSKPVVITFDDGFADQMRAFSILQKYSMKAIYYIIDGGPASNWCIGAGRQYGLASQPPSGCGDQYLSWNQIRELDASGLITIAAHTINHRNLAALSAEDQRYEIVSGKAQLEAELGHAVRHFAYPYGGYNSTTLAIVQQAGFATAVSTIPGLQQSKSDLFTLRRVRTAYGLP